MIGDLTIWVLRESVAQLAQWSPAERVPIAVNLSAHTVVSPVIVGTIIGLLAEFEVEPEHLQVEITETALVADPTRVIPILEALDAALHAIPGVLEHGLFLGMAEVTVVGEADGSTRTIRHRCCARSSGVPGLPCCFR